MSDQPGGSLPELTPEQDAQVRRLLAEARHDEPVPAHVGERLDRVLADLSRDEPGGAGEAPVYDLAARRRRRNAAALLAGAAAVIVAGFGIGQVIDVGGSSDDAADSAASRPADRDQATTGSQQQEGGAGIGSGDDAAGSDQAQEAPSPATLPAPLQLSSSHLEQDLTQQLERSPSGVVAEDAAPDALSAYGCAPGSAGKYGLGELFPALYDGEPAVLALRPATGPTQQADVLACGSADQLASATIPRR